MMQTLSQHPKIVSLARSLGIFAGDPVEEIKMFCQKRVRKLIGRGREIRSIEEIEALVCDKLNITMEEVWTEDDLTNIIDRYARGKKEATFAYLRKDLDQNTFATLVRLKRIPNDPTERYVAVIDCRGEKGLRRYFTRWHEIAHILTTVDQWELPLHRSTVQKDPLETMMDIIAGDIGFYSPMFSPLVAKHVKKDGFLTFDVVRKIRAEFCPGASFQATLNACMIQLQSAAILLIAKNCLKRCEIQDLNQPGLFAESEPVARLRGASSKPNQSAREAGFRIHPNMRIPPASIITNVFQTGDDQEEAVAVENLNWWRSSEGKALSHQAIRVEAMKVRDEVWAIVSPL